MIDVRIATRDDIRHVAYRMWQRGAEEIKKHGDIETEALIKMYIERSHEYARTFYHHGEPVAVFGAYNVGDNEYHTWFTATDTFLKLGKEATKYLRKFIAEEKAKRPETVLQLWSAVDHAEAHRWFGLIGFHSPKKDGIFTWYSYGQVKAVD